MSARIQRFCKTTRWFHWTFVCAFLTLAATGAGLAGREALGLGAESVDALLQVHKSAGVALFVLPGLVFLSGDTAATAGDFAVALHWSREDLRWLALQPLAALGRCELPPAGKLNAGQKLNVLLVAGATLGLGITGVFLWLRPGALLPWFLHLGAFVAWVPMFLGHFLLAVVLPGTRPALSGMVLGHVERAWALHHHPLWASEVPEAAPSELVGSTRKAISPAGRPPRVSLADGGH